MDRIDRPAPKSCPCCRGNNCHACGQGFGIPPSMLAVRTRDNVIVIVHPGAMIGDMYLGCRALPPEPATVTRPYWESDDDNAADNAVDAQVAKTPE